LKEIVSIQEVEQNKSFKTIAGELGVDPSLLSRWIAGKGPLIQNDILSLASNLSPVVYTFLGISRPEDTD
jgi:hypothetical protein